MPQPFFVAESKEEYYTSGTNTYYGTYSTSGVAMAPSSAAGSNGTGVPQASSISIQTVVANDVKRISISPGDVVYLVSISSHQYSYCYGFHYKSLKFFEFNLDNLSLFRPILIEQDAIAMNLKYNNHNELEPHLRSC